MTTTTKNVEQLDTVDLEIITGGADDGAATPASPAPTTQDAPNPSVQSGRPFTGRVPGGR
jgi:hypothetical protein